VFSSKKQIIWSLVILTALLILIPLSCGQVARNKILSFLFETASPLEEDPNANKPETDNTRQANQPGSGQPLKTGQKDSSYQHEPYDDCEKCHIDKTACDNGQFVKAMPDLCYSCHSDFSTKGGYMHGPVVVGACTFCHDPHKSEYVHLLKEQQPKLCFQCHLLPEIESIAEHEDPTGMNCTKCHNPHIGPTRKLLKPDTESRDTSL
jgi:predicted CXXCH cytochrome family protein